MVEQYVGRVQEFGSKPDETLKKEFETKQSLAQVLLFGMQIVKAFAENQGANKEVDIRDELLKAQTAMVAADFAPGGKIGAVITKKYRAGLRLM